MASKSLEDATSQVVCAACALRDFDWKAGGDPNEVLEAIDRAVDQYRAILREEQAIQERPDSSILIARELFKKSGLTLVDVGQRMGYVGKAARKNAWQFLSRTNDPHISMLRKFAQAMGVGVADLVAPPAETKNE